MLNIKIQLGRIISTGLLITLILVTLLGGHKRDAGIMVLLEVECLSSSSTNTLSTEEIESEIEMKCRDIPELTLFTQKELKNLSAQKTPNIFIPSHKLSIDYSMLGVHVNCNLRILDCTNGTIVYGKTLIYTVNDCSDVQALMQEIVGSSRDLLCQLAEKVIPELRND